VGDFYLCHIGLQDQTCESDDDCKSYCENDPVCFFVVVCAGVSFGSRRLEVLSVDQFTDHACGTPSH
jgi:hypothetical protein